LVVGVNHVEEALEELDLSSFLAEELEDHLSPLLDRWAGTGRYGCGGSEADMRLVVEEVHDFLVDAEEAVLGVKRRGWSRRGWSGRERPWFSLLL
jgi:hypothetical protein